MKKKLNTLKLIASFASTVDSLLNEVVKEDNQPTTTTKVDLEKIKAKAQEHHKQIKDQVATLVSNVKENDEVNELMKMVRELKDTIVNIDKVVTEEDVDTENVYQLRVQMNYNISRDDYFNVFEELLRMSDGDSKRIVNEMTNNGYGVVMSTNSYKPLEHVKISCDSYLKAIYSDYDSVFHIEKEENTVAVGEQQKNFKHCIEITKSHVSRRDYIGVFQSVFELCYSDAAGLYEELKKDGITFILSEDANKLNSMCSNANQQLRSRYPNYKPVFRLTLSDNEPEKETPNDFTYHLISKCERSNEALQRGQAINVSVTKDSMLADGYNPDYAEEAFTYLKKLFGSHMSTSKLYITVLSEIANMPSHYVVVVDGKIFTGVHGTGFYVEDLEDFG